MNCYLSDIDYFPLTFKDQPLLTYLNLVNSPFELLPSYNYLKRLRVLDVSGCSDLKELQCLPSTLAELYIYYCNSLNIVAFESHRFTLQEFGYEGCVNLCEVEGLFKLMPVTKLEESDLKHMTWLREYQDLTVCLVGDAELTKGRSSCVQMLYEFNIMSTSLPNIKNSNMMTDTDYMYTSQSTLLSFKVPACPEHRSLEGLIISFQYTAHGEDWVWFAKISTPSGVNLMYNPRVFGKPDEVGMWSSYWPIGKALQIEETVTVSIVVIKGLLDIHWCGASLVYTDEAANEHLQENRECVAILGEDFSEFQLSTGDYYLCRRDFFELMEAGKLTPDWFRILVDDKIDYTEVGGWRMTGKPEHPYQSYTEVKTIRCIMYGPEIEEIYKIAELSKSSLLDKTMESTSDLSKAIPMDMVINETMASTSSLRFDKIESSESDLRRLSLQAPDAAWKHDMFPDQAMGMGGRSSSIETGTKLYISNLDYGVSNEDIKELFAEVGYLKRYSIHYDRSGRSKGTAEIVFSRQQDALAAVKRYNNVQLDGKPMKIEIVGLNIVASAGGHPFANNVGNMTVMAGATLDMSLDDLIKNNKKSGGRGHGRGRSSRPGPTRRFNNCGAHRATPYGGLKAPDAAWKHDMCPDQAMGMGGRSSAIETGTKLYISNLDYGVSNEDIKELFAEVGDLKKYSIHYDRSGRSKGTAEIVFSRQQDALAAVKRYNNVQLDGKPMKIEMVGLNIVAPAGGPPFANNVGNMNGYPRSGQGRSGGFGRPRGGGRGPAARGGRGRGRGGRGEKISADDLDADLEKYHSESMQTN